jgi:predicted nucleotide-binding protein (sugar kinase/HSP70/actin superfamily)
MNAGTVQLARMASNYKHIIDSDGNRVKLNDHRVVHIFPYDIVTPTMGLIDSLLKKRGWKTRVQNHKLNSDVLHHAKKFCSGRECLSFHTIIGGTCKDIEENRGEDEISVYYGLEEGGPCQSGAWPLVSEILARRMKLKNAVFPGHPNLYNNFMGQGAFFGIQILTAVIIGDLLEEAENCLRVVARDHDEALGTFKAETDRLIRRFRSNFFKLPFSLKTWAENMSRIPVKQSVEETPKVLVFGSGSASVVHQPPIDYFLRHGIIPKVVNMSEFILHMESAPVNRFGFSRGAGGLNIYNIRPILLSFMKPGKAFKEVYEAVFSRATLFLADSLSVFYGKIARKSGLCYDAYIPFLDLIKAGHPHSSCTIFHEATETVGRYLCSVKKGVFDGLVHLSIFNCQPSIQARTILQSLTAKNDIPYADIELEGPWITPKHEKNLEAVVVKAKRLKRLKNEVEKTKDIDGADYEFC